MYKLSIPLNHKPRIEVKVIETNSPTTSSASSVISANPECDRCCTSRKCNIARCEIHAQYSTHDCNAYTLQPSIYLSTSQRTRERLRLAYSFAACTYDDLRSFRGPISKSHRFSHRIVNPLFTWNGKNNRVIAGKSLGSTIIQDSREGTKTVIHAGSHNYAGFYRLTEDSEQLHKMALDKLTIAPEQALPALSGALQAALAAIFRADFCYTTSTGYASNLLAFSAVLRPGWLCIMDAKSHNSMHVGAYLSEADKIAKYRHNDMSHLEQLLKQYSSHYDHVLVAVEGLFSMDGTIPPLDKLAQLKKQYGFVLLVDEAHSLLSIGKTGRGYVELWNDTHPEAPVDDELVDLRTAVLSKTLGAIGGMVCGRQKFDQIIGARLKQMCNDGLDPVLTATMVQCLYVLGQPTLLTARLARMRQMSQWARSELKRFGVHVYGDAITPLLPIHVGRASMAAKLSYLLRKQGILATPVSTPAVPFWQSRIRVCLSADHTDAQVNTLVRTIISCAQDVGVIARTNAKPHTFSTVALATKNDDEAFEIQQIYQRLEHLIDTDTTTHSTTASLQARHAGHLARQGFGLAAGGARWISGTFVVHVEVETLIAQSLRLQAALSYSDSYVGLLSTISALCRPLLGRKTHKLCLPKDCSQAVLDGIKAAPRSTSPDILYYDSLDHLETLLVSTVADREQVTIYLSSSQFIGEGEDCVDKVLAAKHYSQGLKCLGLIGKNSTILVHDAHSSLASLHTTKLLGGTLDELRQVTRNLLVYGDFLSSFGVPGGYLAGSQELIEELRYSSRGYMFSTAALPFVMGIVKHGLETLSTTSHHGGTREV